MKTVHLINTVATSDKEASRRYNFAADTWKVLYEAGIIPCSIDVKDLPRNSESIGDTRKLPFIKDLINHAIDKHNPDAIILNNADICLFHGSVYKIDYALKHNDAIFSKRINFPAPVNKVMYETDIHNGKEEEFGADLFGFKVEWWNKIENLFPDFLIGCEQWDTTLIHLINITNPYPEVKNTIYHEEHDSFWKQLDNKNSNVGQVYNQQLGRLIHPKVQILGKIMDACRNPSNQEHHHFLYWVNKLTANGSSLLDFLK